MIRNIWHFYQRLKNAIDKAYNHILFKVYSVHHLEFPTVKGRITLQNLGTLSIGKGCTLISQPGLIPGGRSSCIIIKIQPKATMSIGNAVGVTSSSFYCANNITIEDNVFIGEGCKIVDTDFHSLRLEDRLREKDEIYQNIKTAPVKLSNGCFIGANAIILKGVIIGERSIVGAGAVVTRSIPSRQVWAGNPAVFVRDLRPDEL